MTFLLILLLELIFLYFLSHVLQSSLTKIIFKITKSRRVTLNFLLLLFLPGVIVHELSHFIIASLLFVKIGEINFLPEITEDGVKLGSLEIERTDPVRRAIVGFAPVLIGIIAVLGLAHFFTLGKMSGVGLTVVLFYLLFAITSTMFSSKKDLEGTIELLIVFGIIFLALYITGVKAPFVWFSALFEKNTEIFKKINILLLLPLSSNFILYLATRLLARITNN